MSVSTHTNGVCESRVTYVLVPTSVHSGDLGIQQLSEAVRAIHAKRATAMSLEEYYKMVESACAEGKDQLLYSSLRQICNEHLHQQHGQLIRYPFMHVLCYFELMS